MYIDARVRVINGGASSGGQRDALFGGEGATSPKVYAFQITNIYLPARPLCGGDKL